MSTKTKRTNPKYTLEFKQDAARLVNEKGYTHQQVVDHLGVSLSAILFIDLSELVNRKLRDQSLLACLLYCDLLDFVSWVDFVENSPRLHNLTAKHG